MEKHEAVFGITCSLFYVTLSMREALSICAVHHLKVVENGEDWDGAELASDRLQSQLTSLPKLQKGVYICIRTSK